MSSEVAAAVQQVESVIAGIEGKISTQSQHSPGSNSSSTKSDDSGVEDGSKKSGAPANVSRKSSRLSQSAGVSSVLERLEQMIVSDEWVGRELSPHGHPQLVKTRSRDDQRLSELGRTLVTSASLKAYIDLLSSHHRQSIAAWLYGNTCTALSQQFRFPEANVYCSEPEATLAHSVKNGIGHAVKLALRHTYGSDYLTKGWRAFTEKGAPVVYVSPAHHMDLASFLASEYGIADVVVLPKMESDMADIEGRIDHVAFEKILEEDIAAGKQPLMVVAVVGSTILGQNDMVSRLLEIRKKHRFWLHIVGQAIAALTLREPTEVLVHVLSQVDSMTLPLALWLGIPAAPVVTMHRHVEGYKPSYREKLDSLPWWVATQYLHKRITDIVENAYLLSKLMLKGLASIPQLEVVGMENPTDFASRVYKNQYTAPTVLVFKYKYEPVKLVAKAHRDLIEKPAEEQNHQEIVEAEHQLQTELEYADSLNSWLGQGLLAECQALGIHMIELGGNYGTAFRFCPLEHAASLASHVDHVQNFIRQLTEVVKIATSTVLARTQVKDIKEEFPNLQIMPINKWAGVGAVCYVPSIVKETNPHEWNDNQVTQVSHLNLELVHQLRAVDSAFSSGESSLNAVSCVKFGMLSDPKDLVDLIRMVAEKGKEIENSQQYLDSLADLIRQGIEAANEDLRKENDQRLQNEGVMRQLPLMGTLVNWFSPLDKDVQNIRGRSFNLKTGEIRATDVLYKHRHGSESEEKTPMTPIDTPQAPHGKSGGVPVVQEEPEDDSTTTTQQPVTNTTQPAAVAESS